MIHRVYANDPRFKSLDFRAGLNIIVADRTEQSGKKDTRNGAGKSTLMTVIDFCLGAELSRLNLPVVELHDWEFTIDLDVGIRRLVATRAISTPAVVVVKDSLPGQSLIPNVYSEWARTEISIEEWRRLLGKEFFGLTEHTSPKHKPSYRSLISYFVRRGVESYLSPFQYFKSQSKADWQVIAAYLLGLNWQSACELREMSEQKKALDVLNSAVRHGIIDTQGELEAERVRLEAEISTENAALSAFKVHPQYRDLQSECSRLTSAIHIISNKLFTMRQRLNRYESAVEQESPPDIESVEKLYEEAGLLLPDLVRHQLAEAKEFHSALIRNRQSFLRSEIAEIRNAVESLELQVAQHIDDRAAKMELLRTHGAFEEFVHLQENIVVKRHALQTVKGRIDDLKHISVKRKEIKSRTLEIETKLSRDYEQSRPEWEAAVEIFNANSLALYDEPGRLVIDVVESGYNLDVEISKSGSEGVGKMKIFCYDLMLVELMARKGKIGFLIHDSTIYDGVDSRQRALALLLAREKSLKVGFQYICTLNSDSIPYDEIENRELIDSAICLRLSDRTPEDSALGFHFEIKRRRPKGSKTVD